MAILAILFPRSHTVGSPNASSVALSMWDICTRDIPLLLCCLTLDISCSLLDLSAPFIRRAPPADCDQ